MRKLITSMAATVFACAGSLSSASETTHFNIDFENYPTGPLVTAGTVWSNSGVIPVIENKPRQGNVLSISSTGTGGLTLFTTKSSTNGTIPLNFASNNTYLWGFSFSVPAGEGNNNFSIRLNDGTSSAGHWIAGLTYNKGELRYVVNPNVDATTAQTALISPNDFSLIADQWYRAEFQITLGENSAYSYVLKITGGDQTYTTTVEGLTADYLTGSTNAKMTFSAIDASAKFSVDDLVLRTIPEPGATLLGSAAFVILLWGAFRHRSS